MDREAFSLHLTARMYRGTMTSETFNSLVKQKGAYDILVLSNGNPVYVDRDQIGFRYEAQNKSALNIDVAYQSKTNSYEFAGFRDGEIMTVLGSITCE